jgi:hypothetical protein
MQTEPQLRKLFSVGGKFRRQMNLIAKFLSFQRYRQAMRTEEPIDIDDEKQTTIHRPEFSSHA